MISYDDIANEVLSKLPKLKKGMKFEVMRQIFPPLGVPKNIRNVNEDSMSFTKPLALSSKEKLKIRKRDKNILNDFLNFKKTKKEKGDILVIVEVTEKYALCENISRPKEIHEKYYSDYDELKLVKIVLRDILEGNIKHIHRVRM